MRELTKASEILSVGPSSQRNGAGDEEAQKVKEWDPYVGQVFLGNLNDVPVYSPSRASEPQSHFSNHSSPSISRQNYIIADNNLDPVSSTNSDGMRDALTNHQNP